MGRKVGKKRSEALTKALNAVVSTTNWDTPRHDFNMSRYQWNNFQHFAEKKLWRLAVDNFRKDKTP